jgi:hypothetical protein
MIKNGVHHQLQQVRVAISWSLFVYLFIFVYSDEKSAQSVTGVPGKIGRQTYYSPANSTSSAAAMISSPASFGVSSPPSLSNVMTNTPPQKKMTRVPALAGLPVALPKRTLSEPMPKTLAASEREQQAGDGAATNSKPSGSFTNLACSDVYQFGGVGHMVEGSGTPVFGIGSSVIMATRSEYTEPSSPLRQNFNNLRVNSPHLQSPHFHMG